MKVKTKFMLTSFLGLLIVCNVLVFALADSEVTYPVDHFGYKDDPYKVVNWGGDQDEGSVFSVLDDNGYLYVTCYSKSFGIIGEDVWVIKYDNNMNIVWNVTWQTTDFARPYGIVVDSIGNVYVGGTIVTEVDVGKFIHDAFILKFLPNGTTLWDHIEYNSNQEEDVTSVAIDYSDNIYLIGHTNSSQGDLFIHKYSSGGTLLDTFYYGTIAPREQLLPGGTAIDTHGNIYIAATTDNCPPGNLMDLVLIKLNSTGVHLWNTTFGDTSPNDRGFDVVLSYYNIFVVGDLGAADVGIVKFNSTGSILWSNTWHLQTDHGTAITINDHGNPVIAGSTDYYSATGDIIMGEYLPNGTLLWNESYLGPLADQPDDIQAHGNFLYTLGRSLNATGGYDVVIIVYEDYTVTHYPSMGPYGRIFGSIIGSLIGVIALLFVFGLLYTYWKKS
ncbi:MAG: hypothetical protein FK732_07780 [Asgard group archaeon]|nr:hypothetical protein [Asgard group archaeon]